METIYKHRFSDVTNLENYEVIACYPDGTQRVTDPSNEVEWIKTNTPEKISGNRFVSIVNGVVTLDPNMASILAAEQVIIDAGIAKQTAKAQAYIDNLPSRQAMNDAIDAVTTGIQGATTLAMVRPFLITLVSIVRKIANVVYWLAKDSLT